MDINLNIPPQKQVVSVEILHLDELGYGPQGKHTRSDWQKECWDNLKLGEETFRSWQKRRKMQVIKNLPKVSFGVIKHFDDETNERVLSGDWEKKVPYSLDFAGRIFEKTLNADDYNFEFTTLFHAVIFKKDSNFRNATFEQDVSFEIADFKGFSYFSDANFIKKAEFDECTFFRGAFFINTTFTGEASFPLTTFFEGAFFCGGTFVKSAHFFKTKILNQCRFESEEDAKTSFAGKVNFENAEILNVGHFERVQFSGEIPNFLGVDNSKTLLVFSGDEYFNANDTTEDAVKRIGQLKRLADEQGQTDQALMFNKFELNAKAKQLNAGWGLKVVTGLYDYISDFGRSFLRPLGIYSAMLLLTFLIALEHSAYNAPRNYTQSGCEKYIWWIERVTWIKDKNCLENSNELKLTGIRAASEYTLYRAA